MDKNRIQELMKALLVELGEDVGREGLKDTPERVADMYTELTEGYHMNPSEILEREFNEVTGMVIAKDIGFFSLCEHHLLPFHGKVHIGYIPSKKVVGILKLARLRGPKGQGGRLHRRDLRPQVPRQYDVREAGD